MLEPKVSVQVVVRNGQRYIRGCLDSVRAQTYKNCEVVILDNNSTDDTARIVESEYPEFRLIRHDRNLGMWPGHEFLLTKTVGPYVLALSVDVILDAEFISLAVSACQKDQALCAVQGKVYQYTPGEPLARKIIDTCGFAMTRGRKVVNIGHGEPDSQEFAHEHDVFGVEGAVPFFRRSALEDCKVEEHIWDPDYFWYGDDLDLAWRMTLFGHRQRFIPSAIAWHDRSTTKDALHTGILAQYVKNRSIRKKIPIRKRRLDWSNLRFTIIKNDYLLNILRDLPAIVLREINVQGYAGLFEQKVLLEWGRFLWLAPRMLARRFSVMARARMPANTARELMLFNASTTSCAPPSERWWRLLRAVVVVIVVGFLVSAIYIIGRLIL